METLNPAREWSATSEHNDILKQYDDSLDALAEKVLPAVVQIEVSGFGARETKGGGDVMSVSSNASAPLAPA